MLPLLLLERLRGDPAVAASAPLTGSTAVAPAPLGSAPVLRMLTPVVLVLVAVSRETGMGLAGPRALESSCPISPKGPVDEGSARRRSCRGDLLPPGSREPGGRPRKRPPWIKTAHAKPPLLLDKPEHLFKKRNFARTKGTIRGQNKGDNYSFARPSGRPDPGVAHLSYFGTLAAPRSPI